jgi:quinol monooxygenase YgiN
MYARVWQLRIRPGRTEEFKATLDSLHPTAERQPGYRSFVALGSSKEKAPKVTVISLWDSLEAMRASERNMFLMQAISRLLGCCEGFPQITEQEVLIGEFRAAPGKSA